MSLWQGDGEGVVGPERDEHLPGRYFARWQPDEVAVMVAGAGFDVEDASAQGESVWVDARRARTLADTVGPDMRVLVCGLNPSLVAADAGFGFAGPTNRFWKAAVESGLVTRPRDPLAALEDDGVGMTDLVKRATPAAAEVRRDEYAAGAERVRAPGRLAQSPAGVVRGPGRVAGRHRPSGSARPAGRDVRRGCRPT